LVVLSLTPAVAQPVSFQNDVMPYLMKAGCASGNCHAKPEGQNNFKLSVFGYDPAHDYHEIVRDDRGRRVFFPAPEESLLLKKAAGEVPHEGGARLEKNSPGYQAVLSWIRQGAPFALPGEAKLETIRVEPRQQTCQKGAKLQLKATATYSDGSTRDVTALADYLSQDKEIATVDEHGRVEIGSLSGEGIIVTRYMGLVDVARLTIPAEKTYPASLYAALPVKHEIDRLVYARHQKLGLLPSATCTDEEFLRRVSLDLIGRLPSAATARRFIADPRADKRARMVDELLQDPNYADHWAVKWGDLIRPNPSRVGVKPVYLLDSWLRDSFRRNKPYDQMVRELLTAQGSTHEHGPVAIFRDKRDPVDASGFVSQIFLGVRLDCAKCHHHPSEKWTQEDYYQLAAFFGQMKRKGQGISAPISGEPESWWYGGSGEVTHPVTDAVMVPKPPDGPEMPYVQGQDPREALVDWMTGSSNPFFAKAIVNRIWAEFMGRGIVEPVDDFRVSNPPTHEALLDWLAADFIAHGYDLKHLMRSIVNSNTYQLSSEPNETNLADTKNYARSLRRRLSAEVLLDAVSDLTGRPDEFSGLPPGSRAVQTWNHKLSSDFLDAFGRPNASQECPCERERKPSVVQALHLMNSTNLQAKLTSSSGRVAQLVKSDLPEPRLVSELYLAAYNRLPSAPELNTALRFFNTPGSTRQTAAEDLAWALINSAEFVFNH
jgi:Tfp pilus assembly protein PilN